MTTDLHSPTETVADIAEKLMDEYRTLCSPATVSAVVISAHRDLRGQVPEQALAELLYHLARQRLRSDPGTAAAVAASGELSR